MMSVLKGKKMDKKQVQETYRETTLEEEQEYFEEVENELQCDLQTTQESIDYRNQAIKAQKKYMRDSHGDMDDEEFLQNMNNVNNDTFFIEHAAKQVDVLAHQIERPYFGSHLSIRRMDRFFRSISEQTATGRWMNRIRRSMTGVLRSHRCIMIMRRARHPIRHPIKNILERS